ncbi:hypothetical protein ACFRKB_33755 [Streptomyces scopuliridis]|uniref:hypothetical protein n=1 Tax=Streptomyces scopuliridis TaxID=452529 RepID=UPI00368F10B3
MRGGPTPRAGSAPTGEWESFWTEAIGSLRRTSPWAQDSDAARSSGPAGVRLSPPEPDDDLLPPLPSTSN